MSKKIHLVVVDPQNDFCDLPVAECPLTLQGRCRPALPVPGAHNDMFRLAALIDAVQPWVTSISVTLDTHHFFDIAHPIFWCQPDGSDVEVFTTMMLQDIFDGLYVPRLPHMRDPVTQYFERLAQQGECTHTIWPVHCEIGTWGHNVHAAVHAAYHRWECAHLCFSTKIFKGSNPWITQNSILQTVVPDLVDGRMALDKTFLEQLVRADDILIAGEASSHCIRETTEEILKYTDCGRHRIILITDCMSCVPGFEAVHDAFMARAHAHGVVTMTSCEVCEYFCSTLQ